MFVMIENRDLLHDLCFVSTTRSSLRFKVDQKMDLRDTLQELGIKSIFTTDADLFAMTGETDPYRS